ncbi:MAG: sulfatase-like hydrolase/transferase [Planctomycetota bacterium]|jgi:arylsulfatase A-like enzyme
MTPFRNTLAWVLGLALVVYLLLTTAGYFFITGLENAHAASILNEHLGTVLWLYARMLVGYLAAGVLVAIVLHPFVQGWKAALAAVGLVLLGFLHTLTSETHLLYGPTQTLFCTIHDAIPAWIRNLYHPVEIEIFVGVLALVSLYRWTKDVSPRIRGTVAAVAVIAIGLQFLPAASAATVKRPSFILIATDSLRADHLSCNGYERKTTPHIDALAARGTNFSNCLVPTASTHESWMSMFSSTEPRKNGLRHMFPSRRQVKEIEGKQTFLPAMLRDDGYQTAAIGGWCGTTFGIFDFGVDHIDVSNTQNHEALVAEAAFTNHLVAASFLNNPIGRILLPELNRVSFTRGATSITAKGERWIEQAAAKDQPFFLTLVYHVTHLPYSSSHPYYNEFTDPDYRGRNRYRLDFRIDEMIQRGFDHDLSDEETQHIIDLYDGCVREFDDQVGAIVKKLEELGIADRVIVGVLADHGDDLYEHGTTLGHGVSLFGGDQANHIPAVFAGPGVPKRRVDKLVRSYDLTPTWANWLQLGFRPETWQGVDLNGDVPDLTALLETSYLLYRQPVPDLEPGEKVKGFPQFDQATFFDPEFNHNLVLREELNDRVIETKCFAVRKKNWKLISVPGEKGPIHRLFDLDTDPQCRTNLAKKNKATYEELKKELPEIAR